MRVRYANTCQVAKNNMQSNIIEKCFRLGERLLYKLIGSIASVGVRGQSTHYFQYNNSMGLLYFHSRLFILASASFVGLYHIPWYYKVYQGMHVSKVSEQLTLPPTWYLSGQK